MKITASFQVTPVTLTRQYSSDHTPSATSVIFHYLTASHPFYSSSSNIYLVSTTLDISNMCAVFAVYMSSIRLIQ